MFPIGLAEVIEVRRQFLGDTDALVDDDHLHDREYEWTGDCSRSASVAHVSDEPRAANDYRWARQIAALLLIDLVLFIVEIDVIVEGYEVSPPEARVWADAYRKAG